MQITPSSAAASPRRRSPWRANSERSRCAALGRHWLLYDLAELGELDEARQRHGELELLAADLRQPLYRHASLVWRCVLTALAGRFDEAERLANDSVALAECARAPDARAHYTAQLVALRREQGRLDELLPELERFARDASTVGPWHAILPLAYLDAGDRARARAAYDAALAGGVSAVPRTMFWLASLASLAEAAALLEARDGAAQLYAALEPHADLLAQWSFTGNAGSVHRLLGRTAAAAATARPRARALRERSAPTRRAWQRTAARPHPVRLRRAAPDRPASRPHTSAPAPPRGVRRGA